jgi:hypothetical protein
MADINIQVTCEIDGVVHDLDIDDEIGIDAQDLDGEFVEQARKFARWAMLSELAKDKVATLKNRLEQLYARTDHRVRQEALTSNPPVRLTEKMVENSVITDGDYQQLLEALLRARKEHGLLVQGRESFIQRKEMLISLGANYRAEGAADPVVLREAARERAVQKARSSSVKKKKRPVRRD